MNLDKQLTVLTPENVQVQFRTAGLGSRAAAYIVDAVIIGIVNLFLTLLFFSKDIPQLWVNPMGVNKYLMAALVLLLFLINSGYFIIMEYYRGGQTIGKKITGIRVVQENGRPLTFLSAVIRNFFRLVDSLPFGYFLGVIVVFFHPLNKRIGDMAAGTVIAYDSTKERLSLKKNIEKELAKRQESLPAIDPSNDFKTPLNRSDWQLLAAFMERLPVLSPAKSEELGQQLAGYLLTKMNVDKNLVAQNPVSFLAAVYLKVRDEWDM
jgi:uncharacterized RDD family membrane protein YckC